MTASTIPGEMVLWGAVVEVGDASAGPTVGKGVAIVTSVGVGSAVEVGRGVGVGTGVDVGTGVNVGSGVAVALLPQAIRNNTAAANINAFGGFRTGLLAKPITLLANCAVAFIVEIGWPNFSTVAGRFGPN